MYSQQLKQVKNDPKGYMVYEKLYYDIGSHPSSFTDHECAFVANAIAKFSPANILDIGSYRLFVLGLLSHCRVTTIDVRARKPININEVIITSDAKKLNLPNNEFDAVTSCCALEHFGLGRYGDELDLDADKKAFAEMIRVLKPNGQLVFTTTITRSEPSIIFNAHRIYSYEILRGYCSNLVCEEEKFYSQKLGAFCNLEQVTEKPNEWDIYFGCWTKKDSF